MITEEEEAEVVVVLEERAKRMRPKDMLRLAWLCSACC